MGSSAESNWGKFVGFWGTSMCAIGLCTASIILSRSSSYVAASDRPFVVMSYFHLPIGLNSSQHKSPEAPTDKMLEAGLKVPAADSLIDIL